MSAVYYSIVGIPCQLTHRKALPVKAAAGGAGASARTAAFTAGLGRLLRRKLMRRAFGVRGLAALTGYLALFLLVHHRKAAVAGSFFCIFGFYIHMFMMCINS